MNHFSYTAHISSISKFNLPISFPYYNLYFLRARICLLISQLQYIAKDTPGVLKRWMWKKDPLPLFALPPSFLSLTFPIGWLEARSIQLRMESPYCHSLRPICDLFLYGYCNPMKAHDWQAPVWRPQRNPLQARLLIKNCPKLVTHRMTQQALAVARKPWFPCGTQHHTCRLSLIT